MPYIKIVGSETGNNKGSSKELVNYLDKENTKDKAIEERELFFSHEKDFVSTKEVVTNIDNNKAKLGKDDAKFYMVTINPSEKELKHIGNDKGKLKEYTRDTMNEYAKNFNKGLEAKNLLYYAKIESNRYYKGTDQEVKQGAAKIGEKKKGENMHVHIIVSRKDKENRLKLSPMTNHRRTTKGKVKGGFDRTNFKQTCEKKFDKSFDYKRDLEESFKYSNTMKNGSREERIELKEQRYMEKEKYKEKEQVQGQDRKF